MSDTLIGQFVPRFLILFIPVKNGMLGRVRNVCSGSPTLASLSRK